MELQKTPDWVCSSWKKGWRKRRGREEGLRKGAFEYENRGSVGKTLKCQDVKAAVLTMWTWIEVTWVRRMAMGCARPG